MNTTGTDGQNGTVSGALPAQGGSNAVQGGSNATPGEGQSGAHLPELEQGGSNATLLPVIQADRDAARRAWSINSISGLAEAFARHRLQSEHGRGDVERHEDEPSAWAVEAFRQADEMYASYMGDPDGNDDTETARSEAAKVIERLALAALHTADRGDEVAQIERLRDAATVALDDLIWLLGQVQSLRPGSYRASGTIENLRRSLAALPADHKQKAGR